MQINSINKFAGFIILIMILFLSCQKKKSVKTVVFDTFPIEKNLVSHEINWINNFQSYNMCIYDSILFVMEFRKPFFSFYNINNHKLLASFGKRGKGPDEFLQVPDQCKFFRPDNNEIYFYLIDQQKDEIIEAKLLSSIKSKKIVSQKIAKLSYKLPSVLIKRINDSVYAGTGYDKRGSIFFYNMKQDSVIKWTKRFDIKGHGFVHRDNKLRVNQEYIYISPDRQKIISRFLLLKRIHIYDNQGDILVRIEDKNKGNLDFSSMTATSKIKERYHPIILSNEYILVINNIATNRFSEEDKDQKRKEILVFDYSGNAVAKYKLDGLVYGYAMDWNTKRLYSWDELTGKFVYFDLEGL